MHFIVTAKPYMSGDDIGGVVISFRDIEEAQKLVYNINTRALKNTLDDIVGNSDEIKRAKKQAMITAKGNSTVLITGESGTGKRDVRQSHPLCKPKRRRPLCNGQLRSHS